MNIAHITNDGIITETETEGMLNILKSQQESRKLLVGSNVVNCERIIAPPYDGEGDYVNIICCPYCGNNDPKYNNSIEVVVTYASSGWDVKCKACTPPDGSPEVWTFSPPGINPFGNTTSSNFKKVNKSWAMNNAQ
tara:strand:- start:114 stop:521 length:408 start_codon:yes stop_codon:yes gene_type:complete